MPTKNWMRQLQNLLKAAALSLCVFVSAAASDVRVIANPSVKASAVSSEDLKDVFLLTRTSLSDGSHVEPVLLQSGVTHEMFVRQYIGKTDAALAIYYRSLVFAGKRLMPKALTSDADVVSYVAKTKGAVGYVSAGASVAGVKILDVKE